MPELTPEQRARQQISPLNQRGSLGKAHQLFGNALPALLEAEHDTRSVKCWIHRPVGNRRYSGLEVRAAIGEGSPRA
jgi:hypothetical protein